MQSRRHRDSQGKAVGEAKFGARGRQLEKGNAKGNDYWHGQGKGKVDRHMEGQ